MRRNKVLISVSLAIPAGAEILTRAFFWLGTGSTNLSWLPHATEALGVEGKESSIEL